MTWSVPYIFHELTKFLWELHIFWYLNSGGSYLLELLVSRISMGLWLDVLCMKLSMEAEWKWFRNWTFTKTLSSFAHSLFWPSYALQQDILPPIALASTVPQLLIQVLKSSMAAKGRGCPQSIPHLPIYSWNNQQPSMGELNSIIVPFLSKVSCALIKNIKHIIIRSRF